MAILREQAQFDTSGVRGFDRGGMDWALQSVTYTLKIYDTSDVKVAEIAGDLENTTLTQLAFKTNRKGGCGDFSFTLAEPYTTATIAYNYKVEIYLFNHFSPWFTGYIEEVPDTAGTDSIQNYTGYGYFEKCNKKLVNDSFTAQEISVIATSVLDDDIIANYPAITKNTDKIEATGYTLAGTLQFERQFAKDVFTLLADIANDYEFGVDQDAEFFFRAIDTTILERFWVGTHITDFTPEKDYSQIVNRWYIYAPPFSDGSNYQIMVENAASQSSYGLAEDFIDAPAIISIYSSTNLASGKTPTTSPAAGTPANMTDGDNSTLWESGADQTVGHYIKIDLGATFDQVAKVVLDSIHSTAQEYHATLFKIETSTDDAAYTEVFACTSDPGWKPTVTFQPVAARYILITLTAAVAVHWKVGEAEVYELDTADLERWGAQVLADSKDPILRATATIRGIDKILLQRPVVAAIYPTGKCRITDRVGTTTHDYAIISCEYVLSSSGFDLRMELGHTKPEISDQMRLLRRQIAENRLLGIRRGDNLASGTGLQQGIILSTYIGAGEIQTPHLAVNSITADKYFELRNTYVFSDQDSLDASFPFEMDFEIVSEMTAIETVKLSFRIREFRAYATTVPSGGGHTTAAGGGSTSGATGSASGGGDTSGAESTHSHEIIGFSPYYTSYSDPENHRHTFSAAALITESGASHTHSTPNHSHPNHQHSTPNHQHAVSNHTHSLTFGIYEDSTSPTIHYHIDNGGGYGGASGNYNSDQLDLVITGSISGAGFKRIKFDSDLRCRISSWVMLKIDLTA